MYQKYFLDNKGRACPCTGSNVVLEDSEEEQNEDDPEDTNVV